MKQQTTKNDGNVYFNTIVDFHNIFGKEVVPVLRNFEVYRIKELRTQKTIIFILTLLLIVFLILSYYYRVFLGIAFTYFMVSSILYYPYLKKKEKRFQTSLKENCFSKVLKAFGDLSWHSEFSEYDNGRNYDASDSMFKASGLFPDYNRRYTDDVIQGSWKGIPFKITETNLILETKDSKGRKEETTIFDGLIIEFKIQKQIKNRTIVATKGDATAKFNVKGFAYVLFVVAIWVYISTFGFNFNFQTVCLFAIGFVTIMFITKKINDISVGEALDEVELEDPEFNKKYNVYSSDQIEARYLVTAGFMERFKNIQTYFKAQKTKCSFFNGNTLMFAISTKKDLFELGDLSHSLLNSNTHNDLFNTLYSIFDLVNHFKLDEKTGL